jgi:D-alanyl-D-alanine carboxypeptidase
MRSSARATVTAAMAILIAGCSASPDARPPQAEPTSKVDAGTTAPSPQPSPMARLGDFPEFPKGPLPEPVAASLQGVLDEAVEQGTFLGVTAAVIAADSGSWSGAAGVDLEQNSRTPDTRLLIARVGNTVTAAQVLRLVDEGKLGLDDPAADHLPPELEFFDANGATIRDVLGMRSGIPDPANYVALVDSGSTPAELLEEIDGPLFPAGSEIAYANINYVLLGTIIEHVTGRPLWEVLRTGVLDRPGLDGLVYPVKDALAADGWKIESDPASLARWGYELYGGYVLSDDSLRQMTDFHGEFYGLGAIDLREAAPEIFGDIPAIGHGGEEPSTAVTLVAFPQTDVVVAVQAIGGGTQDLDKARTVAVALRDAAQP